jgi:hypothetical protein
VRSGCVPVHRLLTRFTWEATAPRKNSIFTYTFNFTSAPVLQSTTPAGAIVVFDPTFALARLIPIKI